MNSYLAHLFTFRAALNGASEKSDIQKGVDFLSETVVLKRQFQLLAECLSFVQEESERRLNSALLRIGVASLPDEILSVIFAFASQCESIQDDHNPYNRGDRFVSKNVKQFFSAVSLSHVCRRFRHIILSAPEFWTSIWDNMRPGVVEFCLVRSGAMPLELFLDSFCNAHSHPEFYSDEFSSKLIASSPRWRNLTIKVAPFDVVMRQSPFESVEAPQLKTLSIHSPLKFPVDPDNIESRISACHKWAVPLLQSLNIYQFIPPPFHHATSLRNLHVELGVQTLAGGSLGWILDINALGQFLQSFPALANLSMKIAEPHSVINPPSAASFSLPNVENVTLSFPSCKSSMIAHLLGNIRFPASSTLNVSFGLAANKGSSLTTKLFLMFNIFTKVVNLKLNVYCNEGDYALHRRAGEISVPFSVLGRIREFTFTVSNFELQLPSTDTRIPPLRSLNLIDCMPVPHVWVYEVLKLLDNQGDLDSLEKLRIYNRGSRWNFNLDCRPLSPESILKRVRLEKSRSSFSTV
ncbi:hypothetical protein SCHPADRAFT_899317 [Schizopora paradoxa]|uniref:Uncharacterized protein n=1 Tax=Schizopora paradoxa TaxID=27342 RepID=A0A0H2S406_9AGAM|nr:hypothetical protein SCHPADRAFT_899317 [Schizopora paradoxa]